MASSLDSCAESTEERRQQASGTNIVYAMTKAEAADSGNLVMGSCMIAGESLCVLYDHGATHSFVSETCV